jgi:F-type H+-transporting ATPase subunit delta
VRGETIARSYAEALFELAQREESLEAYGEALAQVAALLDDTPELRLFLETPRVEAAEKKKVLRKALEGRIPEHILNFLLVVIDRRRQRLIAEMATAYRELVDAHLGRTHVDVSVARPLDDEERDFVQNRLSLILGKEAIPHVRVQPELLGGILFRSGDTIFDGSVRRQLQRMRRQLMTADVSTE